MVIRDKIDLRYLDVVTVPKGASVDSLGNFSYPINSLRYDEGGSYRSIEIKVRIKGAIENAQEICNTNATISASNATKATATKVCIKVIRLCPYDQSINSNNPDCVKPKVTCEILDADVDLTFRKVKYETTAWSSNDALVKINSYSYDFGDGQTVKIDSDKFTNSVEHTYEPGEYTASVVISFTAPTESGQTDQTQLCERTVKFDGDKPIVKHKLVENITLGLSGKDAEETVVGAGNELEYLLSTENTQNYDRVAITVSDYIGDVLDYAVLDEEALIASGGKYDKDSRKVIWENMTIPAKSTLETTYRVTMKSPIPATNNPSDQAGDFDCVISNKYGDRLSLDVACPAVKAVETIPNTGPGTSLAIIGVMTTGIGYFFARSQLFSKEIELIRTDYAATGGA